MSLRTSLRITWVVLLLLPLCFGQTTVPVRYDLQGQLNGVPYRILVPMSWNGTLLVYEHGYGPYEVITPPWLAPQISTPAAQDAEVQLLLGKGFALAASRFAGSGWQMKEAMANTVALTSAFRDNVGLPKRTIIWGKSMGGLMTLGMIEKFPGLYNGAVALCPPAAGTPRRFDQALDIALSYAAVFDWNANWGSVGNLRNDLNFTNDLLPAMMPLLTPTYKAQWEFIRLVNKMPPDSYYAPANSRVIAMYFATEVRAELEERAGGPVAQNLGRTYALTDPEKASLRAMNPAFDPDVALAKMNGAPKISAAINARLYAAHYVNPTGTIRRPVVTLHTEGDPIAIPNHEGAYWATVHAQGNDAMLLQAFTTGPAHCSFTPQQEIAGVDAMMSWLDTGARPDPNLVFAPIPGFDVNYVIPGWPW